MKTEDIVITGLHENNLKNVNLRIPRQKLVVFTGVSGSGKSSIVFDTIGAESQRQMNESYSAFIRSRLPKHPKPHADRIENLTASVIVDQSPLGGNARSTVGTISDMYAQMRLIFSRTGTPYVGTASFFSFNDPNGMCKTCSGMGKVTRLNTDQFIDREKSLNEGAVLYTLYRPQGYYWKQLEKLHFFDMDKKIRNFTTEEYNMLMYGNRAGKENPRESKYCEGLVPHFSRLFLHRDLSSYSKSMQEHQTELMSEAPCPDCGGTRLNETARSCRVAGHTLPELCAMEFTELYEVLGSITDKRVATVIESLRATLSRLISIGLPYLSLDRESDTLSGGEAQRLKLVRYMSSSLTDLTYIFDEPSTGLHPRDVWRMTSLLSSLRDKGNTVLVVEHDRDVIAAADEVIDVGPGAGRNGGQIVFQGPYERLLSSGTLTGSAMKTVLPYKNAVRTAKGQLPVNHASVHNLKDVSVNIPEGVLTVVTGVAGSGKSSLISHAFAEKYADRVIRVDQGPITATNRSMPASFLGCFDEIRKLFAAETGEPEGLFSFNSEGACPVCSGKGVIVTELVFMDPVVTPCEACGQTRYNDAARNARCRGKSIVDILDMSAEEALSFFSGIKSTEQNRAAEKSASKICRTLRAMIETGLSYLDLGQPLSTLSGGERQRIKLAKSLGKKGSIYILDEPTTGLHVSDTGKLLTLFDRIVDKGNTMVIIEHDLDVVRHADWVLDIGPDGGKNGGQVVFEGTPLQMRDNAHTITAEWLRKQEGIQD
ncbi:MAG: excinuclease ABC subunit UvrA [Treponema sp.]|nr:excinuclease ABC subunit UvrA [Treponema sp.]